MLEAKNEHKTDVGATLNAPAEVVLFHPNGKSLRVPEADAAFWLDQGFRHQLADIKQTADELKALWPAALDAILEYVDGVVSDGVIDTADTSAKATAEYAMRRLEIAWGQLIREIETRYPVRQGVGVQMTAPDGKTHEVDPAQVGHYEAQGWKK